LGDLIKRVRPASHAESRALRCAGPRSSLGLDRSAGMAGDRAGSGILADVPLSTRANGGVRRCELGIGLPTVSFTGRV
jgi:hypothetical protein